jgi:hypothetical protein
MTHEEREIIQGQDGGDTLKDDVALIKMRLSKVRYSNSMEAEEQLANSIADIIGRLHGVTVTKEELGL